MYTERMVDVLVVGAGPAGLSAAVNAASEGLNTLVVDSAELVGGQAKYSSRVENLLGFPNGISGQNLMRRAGHQAGRFGARFMLGQSITHLYDEGELYLVEVGGELVTTRVLLVCCGLEWRALKVPGADRLLHRGLFYGALPSEGAAYQGQTVGVVGGANSAVQAALNFSDHGAAKVWLIVRGAHLEASEYLAAQVAQDERITVLYSTEVRELLGVSRLEGLTLSDGGSLGLTALFVFIGAEPRTDWVQEFCECDERGYLKADAETGATSRAGIFAAGDVVSGSTKRIAAAIGSGSNSVQHIHKFLAATQLGRAAA